VFFSAILAGYCAWRTVSSSPETDMILQRPTDDNISSKTDEENNFRRMMQNGFWVLLDMASGRYLWRNLSKMKEEKVTGS